MKNILLPLALVTAVVLTGCGDSDSKNAGAAGGLYFVDGDLIPDPQIVSLATAFPPDEQTGFGIIAENGQAAFAMSGNFYPPLSVGTQDIGPTALIYYGKVAGKNLSNLPEGPVEEYEVVTPASGKLDMFFNEPWDIYIEGEESGYVGTATLNTDLLEDEGDFCAGPWADEDTPRSVFLAIVDLFDPAGLEPDDPIGEFVEKAFCVETEIELAFKGILINFGFFGVTNDGIDLLPDYETESDLADLNGGQAGAFSVSLLGEGYIGTVDINDDGSITAVDGVCDINGQFSIIDEDYNVYGLQGELDCGPTVMPFEGLATTSTNIPSISIPCSAEVAAQDCGVPHDVTQIGAQPVLPKVTAIITYTDDTGEYGDVMTFEYIF